NVGFTNEDTPKLLDFGLVRILDEVLPARPRASGAPPRETGFGGTPLYMSPEALDGGRPDPGFDLWGLATVTYEALTGRHPFARESATATLSAIRAGWTDALAVRLPANALAARELFETALAADRTRRPQTASELAERIRKTVGTIAA